MPSRRPPVALATASQAEPFGRMNAQEAKAFFGAAATRKGGRKPSRAQAVKSAPARGVEAAVAAQDEKKRQVLLELGLSVPEPKKKRAGVREQPIFESARECSIRVEASERHATFIFEGARLLSLNEMFAMLQVRAPILFQYKKLWRQITREAFLRLPEPRPRFEACALTLFRQGRRKIDRDSIEVMFKFIIDALKDSPKEGFVGLFPDDDPDVVQNNWPQQSVGEPMIGLRVDVRERLSDTPFDPLRLLDNPSQGEAKAFSEKAQTARAIEALALAQERARVSRSMAGTGSIVEDNAPQTDPALASASEVDQGMPGVRVSKRKRSPKVASPATPPVV